MTISNSVLREAYRTQTVRAPDGETLPLRGEIGITAAECLYRTVLERRPPTAIEIGMANGLSSLAILTAMQENGTGRLISIDPNQSTQWRGVGVHNVAMAGLSHRHELVEDADYLALPRLVASGLRLQFAYIDGWHTFDYVALDHFYLDKMLDVSGILGFNDCGHFAVHRAISLLTNESPVRRTRRRSLP